ncbi:MAG: oxidoreductase [Intrasporangiaceae bacterium]|nr:oxidoreductase [Intrasporangiaceae bacterium]
MAAENKKVWHTVTVESNDEVAEGIRRIVLRYPTRQKAKPGTHVDLEVPQPSGETLSRSYSIVDVDPTGHLIALSVLKVKASRGGSAAMHTLSAGTSLRATEPLQNFPLGVGASRYVLVAGGIGVTALVGMAAVLKARGADYEMVYVGRSRDVMAYLSELEAEHGDRLRVYAEGSALDVDALLDEIAADTRAASTELYLCGPIRLMDEVRRGWEHHGLPATNLRFETFGNSGSWAPQDFIVRIPRLGVEARVDANTTMLEALESLGVEMMFDCRKGECGLCEVRVLELDGQVDHRDVFLSRTQREEGTRMCSCVSRVVAAGTPVREDPEDETVDLEAAARNPGVVTIETT